MHSCLVYQTLNILFSVVVRSHDPRSESWVDIFIYLVEAILVNPQATFPINDWIPWAREREGERPKSCCLDVEDMGVMRWLDNLEAGTNVTLQSTSSCQQRNTWTLHGPTFHLGLPKQSLYTKNLVDNGQRACVRFLPLTHGTSKSIANIL